MSLVAFGIRIATVRAIRAVVWPEFVVADSPENPLALLEDGKPLIAIFTGHTTDRMEGRELYAGDPRVTLTIQVFLAPRFAITTGAGTVLTFDTRQEGAETVLDVVGRRILGAFLDAGATPNPWSVLWQQLVQTTARTGNVSYLVATDKVRTAARELTIECGTLDEPSPGAPPAGVWADLVALMRTDTGARSVAPLADWVAAEIQGPSLLTQDERDRIDLGLSRYAAHAISLLPIVPGSEIAVDEIDVDEDGNVPLVIQPTPSSEGAP